MSQVRHALYRMGSSVQNLEGSLSFLEQKLNEIRTQAQEQARQQIATQQPSPPPPLQGQQDMFGASKEETAVDKPKADPVVAKKLDNAIEKVEELLRAG